MNDDYDHKPIPIYTGKYSFFYHCVSRDGSDVYGEIRSDSKDLCYKLLATTFMKVIVLIRDDEIF